MSLRLHVTSVPARSQKPWALVADRNVTPAGSDTVATTPVALAVVPESTFRTVAVYVNVDPMPAGLVSDRSSIDTSGPAAPTAIDNGCSAVCCGFELSWTPTRNATGPATVGVPEITPLVGESASPVGSVPSTIDHVRAPNPPVAKTVALYGASRTASGRLAVKTVSGPPPLIWNCRRTVRGVASNVTSSMMKLTEPAAVGVPLITPVPAFRTSPAGSNVPSARLHCPERFASSCCEYGVPRMASGSEAVRIVRAIATGGCVMPIAASSLLTDCATATGVTAAAGSNVMPSFLSGSKTRNVTLAVSPGARATVAFSIAGFSTAGSPAEAASVNCGETTFN